MAKIPTPTQAERMEVIHRDNHKNLVHNLAKEGLPKCRAELVKRLEKGERTFTTYPYLFPFQEHAVEVSKLIIDLLIQELADNGWEAYIEKRPVNSYFDQFPRIIIRPAGIETPQRSFFHKLFKK